MSIKKLLILVFIFSLAFADSYTQTFSGGRAGENGNIYVNLTTNIISDPVITLNQTTYTPGSSAKITIYLPFGWGSSTFKAVAYVPENTNTIDSTYSWQKTNMNWVSNSAYSNYIWYFDNCKRRWSNYAYSCTNNNAGASNCYLTNLSYAHCFKDFVASASSKSVRQIKYKPFGATTYLGNGTVAAFCTGTLYVNGTNKGPVESNSVQTNITLPGTPGTYNIPISVVYRCFFAVKEYIQVSGSWISDQTTLYDNFSHNTSTSVNIIVVNATTCTDNPSISISSPTINLNCTNNQSNITLTITNTGNVSVTVSNIITNLGTFTLSPSNQLPKTLTPGQSYYVNGTFTYSGTLNSVTFTALGNASNCSQQINVTASSISAINRTMDSASLSITGPSPIYLNCSNQSTITLTITNTGNVSLTVSNITTNQGTFTLTPSNQLPKTLNPGQSFQLTGIFTYNGSTPIRITFTLTANGTVCGQQRNITATWSPWVYSNCTTTCPTPSFSLSVTPTSINFTTSDRYEDVVLRITNNDATNLTINSIVLTSTGGYTPQIFSMNVTLPYTVPANSYRDIRLTIYWDDSIPTSNQQLTFLVNGSNPCGSSIVRTINNVTVTSPCPDRYSFNAVASPNPLVLNATNQARVNITITNTGNISLNVTNIIPSSGSLTNLNTSYPLTVPPGQSRTIEGTYTWSGRITTLYFRVLTSAYPCGNLETLSNITNVIIVQPCTQNASMIMTGPATIALNGSNQSIITFNITNTGNVNITLTGITPSLGQFTSAQFPYTIAPGNSVLINGTYTYNGATPATITFTAIGNATVCGQLRQIITSSVVNITSCLYAEVTILGYLPDPLILMNNRANLTLSIMNSGSVPINITNFSTSNGFIFTPQDTLPVSMSVGQIRPFTGELRYIGSGTPPSQFNITVFATTTSQVCGLNNSNATIIISVSTGQLPDLIPLINTSTSNLGQQESRYVNISVKNIGRGEVINDFYVNVTIMRCNPPMECETLLDDSYLVLAPLVSGEEKMVVNDIPYSCDGWSYVYIMAYADANNGIAEESENNNQDEVTIQCSKESCSITGPTLIAQAGEYKYTSTCFDRNHTEVNCSTILNDTFRWSYSPPSGTLMYYENVFEGDVFETSVLRVLSNPFANGTLYIQANGTLKDYENAYIVCNYTVAIAVNPCINQI